MQKLTLEELAKMLAPSPQQAYDPGKKRLMQQLYRAYARLTDKMPEYEALCALAGKDPKYAQFVFSDPIQDELIPWYLMKYAKPAGETEGGAGAAKPKMKGASPGVDRGVTSEVLADGSKYHFDEPLSKTVLERYLLEGKPLRNADALDFVLHMAVAVHMAPEDLDDLLMDCGFHPLHVKNVHHMAIYAVLRELQNGSLPPDTNPFAEVKAFFLKARDVLLASGQAAAAAEAGEARDAFDSGSTRLIRNYIAEQTDLTRERALAFIRNHPEIYGMRHTRLLAEHRRLADLFSELYDPHKANWTWEKDVTASAYCFYRFLDEFCQPTDRKHYNDLLYNWVHKKGRHPTREIMIALWIYAFCFLFAPEIDADIPGETAKRWCAAGRTPFSGREDKPFAGYQDPTRENRFRVFDYLARRNSTEEAEAPSRDSRGRLYGAPLGDFSEPMRHRPFLGEELIAFLNDKLDDYSWRVLDKRNPFDATVLTLRDLEITFDGSDGPVCSYDDQRLSVPDFWQENVPAPLVLIVELLHSRRELDESVLPLALKCYELI